MLHGEFARKRKCKHVVDKKNSKDQTWNTKTAERERRGEAGRKQPRTSKELPAVMKEGNGS